LSILLEDGEILTLWLLSVPPGFYVKQGKQCTYNAIEAPSCNECGREKA